MSDSISRDTILRIVLATGPVGLMNSPTVDDHEQIGATEALLAVAERDRRDIHKRYSKNKSRKVGPYVLTYCAASVLARVEWIEALLAEMERGGQVDV